MHKIPIYFFNHLVKDKNVCLKVDMIMESYFSFSGNLNGDKFLVFNFLKYFRQIYFTNITFATAFENP